MAGDAALAAQTRGSTCNCNWRADGLECALTLAVDAVRRALASDDDGGDGIRLIESMALVRPARSRLVARDRRIPHDGVLTAVYGSDRMGWVNAVRWQRRCHAALLTLGYGQTRRDRFRHAQRHASEQSSCAHGRSAAENSPRQLIAFIRIGQSRSLIFRPFLFFFATRNNLSSWTCHVRFSNHQRAYQRECPCFFRILLTVSIPKRRAIIPLIRSKKNRRTHVWLI